MKKKRLLSWFLAVVMLFGMLPITAWGEVMPFTAAAGEALEIEKSSEDYRYTVVTEYDENWNPVRTEQRTVTQYEVKVPADAEEIIFTFAEDRLAYGYDDTGNYVASYGDYGDGTTGQKTAVIAADHLAEYVRVQTPYDSNWNSDFLYAIHLSTETGDVSEPETGEVSADELLKKIANSYQDVSEDGWIIMDMAAYEGLKLDGAKTSANARQKYINSAITAVADENAGETTYTKAILALTSIGVDAEELYPENSTAPISAVAGLNTVSHGSSAWVAPYTLAVYGQKGYKGTEEPVKAIIDAVLANQQPDGSWSEYGYTVQTTANVLAGLAFYQDRADVQAAIEKAVDYLSAVQGEDGRFDDDPYGGGPDANTAAMVVIGLAAVGIDPADFVKNGHSAMDGLLSFALTDNSGFGYTNNTTPNSYATEQAFRALIAAKLVMDIGKAFNIYDFSHNADSLQPGYVKAVEDKPVEPEKPKGDEITVKVSIKAIDEYWMKNKSVSIEEDFTVYDAFLEALEDSDIEQEGAKNGYIESMTKDGVTLSEFDEGDNSGWLYKVNDELPDVGIKDYELEDGDKILFYYTQDWKKDPDAGSRYEKEEEMIEEEIVEEEIPEEVQEELPLELPVLEETYTDISADSYYYEAAQWAVAKGIVSGVTETDFGADWNCSRGQLMTFLWRMMGSPEPATQTAPYIDVAKDMYYHDAILWATENGLANGTDGISFSPEMTLNRGQAVTFFWRAAGMPEPASETDFVDVNEEDYFCKAVQWAAENGITSGTGDGCFSPETPCTRGQIVTFLYRCFGK